MHIDMHYAGTYAMAKLAGLNDESAHIIANSAQFVDDALKDVAVIDENSGRLYASEISARHCGTLEYIKKERANLTSYIDQLNIWLPFHFLPGNNGDLLTQKLVCQTDSKIAQEMIQSHINYAIQLQAEGKPWGNYLVGLAAHVYADTFAHYGFSGISSRRNLVASNSIREVSDSDSDSDNNNVLEHLYKDLSEAWGTFANIKHSVTGYFGEKATQIGEGAMGHSGVGKLPDLPYLVYKFQYKHEDLLHGGQSTNPRNNPLMYLNACKRMHEYFSKYAEESNQKGNDFHDFADVEKQIQEILGYREEYAKTRLKHWQEKSKDFWEIDIPDYEGISWQGDFIKLKTREDVLASDAYRFYRASAHHKNVVLNEILPRHGIDIECRQFRAGSFS